MKGHERNASELCTELGVSSFFLLLFTFLVLNEIVVRGGAGEGAGLCRNGRKGCFFVSVSQGRLHNVEIGCRTNSKSWTNGQNYRDFRDLFSCTFFTKDFPEIVYLLSTLSKTGFASRQPGNLMVISGIFFLYDSYEGLPGNRV